MPAETPTTKLCPCCQEPRRINQFRKRAGRSGVYRQAVCRRCTKLATRRARWQARIHA